MQFRYAHSIGYRENKLIAIICECQIASCNSNDSYITIQFSGLVGAILGNRPEIAASTKKLLHAD